MAYNKQDAQEMERRGKDGDNPRVKHESKTGTLPPGLGNIMRKRNTPVATKSMKKSKTQTGRGWFQMKKRVLCGGGLVIPKVRQRTKVSGEKSPDKIVSHRGGKEHLK